MSSAFFPKKSMAANTAILVNDAFDASSVEHVAIGCPYAYFLQILSDCRSARIYHGEFSQSHDVTPYDAFTAKRLMGLQGRFIVVRYPAGLDPISWIIIAAVTAVISVAVTLLMPMPNAARQNSVQQSPNNELASRQNQPRINGRIPDIYGTRIATPDLIAVPYTVYENNREVEYCTMGLGCGFYYVGWVNDDKTRFKDIDGSSAQFYDPGTDIFTGTPFYSEGNPIESAPLRVRKSNSVNGQVLKSPSSNVYDGSNKTDVYFEQYGVVKIDTSKSSSEELAALDLRELFQANDRITIQNAKYQYYETDYLKTGYLDGTYTIGTVDQYSLTLSDYDAVRPNDWRRLQSLNGNRTQDSDAILSGEGGAAPFVGSFVIQQDGGIDRLIFNFVALNGLYADNGSRKQNLSITLDIEINYKLTETADARAPEHVQVTLTGNGQQTIGKTVTHELDPVEVNFYSVNVARLTGTDHGFSGSVVDEVKWSALYSAQPFPRHVFDDITVVRSRTIATAGALSVKERKLNCLVTRKLQSYRSGLPGPVFVPTNNAADILVNMALDPRIGRRTVNELDIVGIYQTIDAVADYFGTPWATEFCDTLDDNNLSFEETVAIVADAVFCNAYRMNNQLHTQFERINDNSKVLFNHRNKAPRSETRTMNFGIENDYDGVEYEWINPDDDSKSTIYVPHSNLINPKKITGRGVRNNVQAHFAAHRAWNKLKYQSETVRFTAYGEADLVTLRDRILVADNTRTGTQDGEIENLTGLVAATSQPVNFEPGKSYTIHLQLKDGSVDSMPVTAGSDEYHVSLGRAPLQPLVFDDMYVAKTAYMVSANDDARQTAFLVVSKSPQAKFVTEIEAVNYDPRYYQNDNDFINGLVS